MWIGCSCDDVSFEKCLYTLQEPTNKRRKKQQLSVCKMWATHSHPALVDKAYWKGAVATSAVSGHLLRNCSCDRPSGISPTTMPLTPPSGFLSAVSRPNLNPGEISSGVSPRANADAARESNPEACSDSNKGERCSTVVLEGPPAAPRRAVRRQVRNSTWSISNGLIVAWEVSSLGW